MVPHKTESNHELDWLEHLPLCYIIVVITSFGIMSVVISLIDFYVRSNLTEAQFCVNGTRRIAQSRHFPEKSYLAVFPRLLLPPLWFPEIIHKREKHHCFGYTVQ